MPANAESGRTFVIAVIVAKVLTSLAVISFSHVLNSQVDLQSQLVRFGITVALSVQLYRGAVWAKWVLVFLFGLAGLAYFPLAPPVSPLGFAFAAMGLVSWTAAGVLAFNPSIRLYLEHKTTERRRAELGTTLR